MSGRIYFDRYGKLYQYLVAACAKNRQHPRWFFDFLIVFRSYSVHEKMKTRESGMPDEQMWDTFFDPEGILKCLGIHNLGGAIVDMGCGFGTFTIPAARNNPGPVYAIDIEKEMIKIV